MTEAEISAFKTDLRGHDISGVEVDHFGGDTYVFDGPCAQNYQGLWRFYHGKGHTHQSIRVFMAPTVTAMPKIRLNRIRTHQQTIEDHPDLFKAVMLYDKKPLGVLWA